ncbi:MAG: hypothetical protein IKK69_04530 [Firmicutes bacterium]|nr:hypothetical protein [Bacillota bacterium]
MAPCCQNYVTPTMIKKGQVTVGDRIQLDEDVLVSAPAEESVSADISSPSEESVPAAATMSAADQQFQAEQRFQAAENADRAERAEPAPGSSTVTQNNWGGTWGNVNGMGGMNTAGNTAAGWGQPGIGRPVDLSSLPLIFDEMTNYANTLNNHGGNTPDYGIPSHPMVPPEYGQSIDYDSMQYMNGFLRTQIGRGLMVQQLIGSGNTVDRYGFLVGVGNNYLLLQDITNGNIMVVDFYTVKYVYIYYSQPVFPSFRPPEAR